MLHGGRVENSETAETLGMVQAKTGNAHFVGVPVGTIPAGIS